MKCFAVSWTLIFWSQYVCMIFSCMQQCHRHIRDVWIISIRKIQCANEFSERNSWILNKENRYQFGNNVQTIRNYYSKFVRMHGDVRHRIIAKFALVGGNFQVGVSWAFLHSFFYPFQVWLIFPKIQCQLLCCCCCKSFFHRHITYAFSIFDNHFVWHWSIEFSKSIFWATWFWHYRIKGR